jgi:hypothetical protein
VQALRAQNCLFLLGSKRHENISINRSAIIAVIQRAHREPQHAPMSSGSLAVKPS